MYLLNLDLANWCLPHDKWLSAASLGGLLVRAYAKLRYLLGGHMLSNGQPYSTVSLDVFLYASDQVEESRGIYSQL